MERPAVRARGLVKRYGSVVALDGVDLEVPPGETFGLLGPNGAGKTTTVKILITLAQPDRGMAEVGGVDVVRDPVRARRLFGYVPQELTADRSLTARESLRWFSDLYHLPRSGREARVAEALRLVGLEEAADRPTRTFSGGMKKKLDLACGLIHRPRILFLDEPSLGLDVKVRSDLWRHVASLKASGVTVFLSTNYMDEADRLCDRVAIIDRGRIAVSGTPSELRAALGGDVVTLEAPQPDGEPLAPLAAPLSSLPFVKETRLHGSRLTVYVEANETAVPRILELASRHGTSVHRISYSRPGLDEVFLKYTGHRFEDAPHD
ncbi:MAG TPA: ATP-binding cassette domain-containing protein [Candidatus Polarisedimenticolia bacterium]|nr:ATP-binding cassette domain-containing protein [Candidatus Polarisedimenticolia bacterium]